MQIKFLLFLQNLHFFRELHGTVSAGSFVSVPESSSRISPAEDRVYAPAYSDRRGDVSAKKNPPSGVRNGGLL